MRRVASRLVDRMGQIVKSGAFALLFAVIVTAVLYAYALEAPSPGGTPTPDPLSWVASVLLSLLPVLLIGGFFIYIYPRQTLSRRRGPTGAEEPEAFWPRDRIIKNAVLTLLLVMLGTAVLYAVRATR